MREIVEVPVLDLELALEIDADRAFRAADLEGHFVEQALDDGALRALLRRARDLGLAALVEVHNEDELARAIDSGARLIGVNNRNLRTLAVDVDASYRLAARIPSSAIGVSESGLQTRADLQQLTAAGYRAFLIGERFMTDAKPADALRALLQPDGGVPCS